MLPSSLSQSVHLARNPNAFPFLETPRRIRTTSTSLAMSPPIFHMGHSHAHHDYDHDQNHDPNVRSKSRVSPKQKAQKIRRQRRRRFALSLFCALATVASKMIQQRPFQKIDWIIMTLSIVALSSADKIRRNLLEYFQKLRGLGDAIAKHSGGNQSQSTSVLTNSISFLPSQPQLDTTSADRVTWIGVVINILLSVGKLTVGITQHSSVLIADAGHSFSDLISDFITLWSVRVARLPADEDHPYGHTKFEAIGSLFLSLTLLATGLSVGAMAQKQLAPFLSGNAVAAAAITVPGPLALFMAGLSIASKEWLYRITKVVGEKLNSPVVIANAWHHRSDAYSSVLALLSIAWAMSGFAAADAAAGLLVAGMIGMTGCDIMVESIQQLSDSAHLGLQEEIQSLVEQWIDTDTDVIKISSLRARQVGSSAFCDVIVETSPKLSTTATRAVEERLKRYVVRALSERTGQFITATIHAKAPLVICPLLDAAESASSKPQKEKEHEVPKTDRAKVSHGLSASQVEMRVRKEALLLDPHHEVQSVTVHYHSPQSVSVDVTIRPSSESDLQQLRINAKRLKSGLEDRITEIQSAQIFLDLLGELPHSSEGDGLSFLFSSSSSFPVAKTRLQATSNFGNQEIDPLSILPSYNTTVFDTLWNGSLTKQNSTSVERMP